MKIVVCVKQVPITTGTNKIDPNTLRIVREGVDAELDPADEYGIEAALQLIEAQGGEITLVSMGPDRAIEAIRRGLAMGADKAIHISDPALSGSDALTTARILAAAIKRVNPDLVICATESSDAYTGIVPAGIAQLLDIPQLTFAKKLTVENGKATIQRQIEGGYQTVEASLPALVTVTGSINEPRYPALKGIMQAKKKPVETLTAADLGFATSEVGSAGAKERVLGWNPAPQRQAGVLIKDDGNAAVAIADYLQKLKVI
ncbi:MAG: electron transfer flavoprotein subunit beta/FixA family protein [Chloroflexi bacterium]|uniref:Electron transfer flavoprotein subunit beta/FixA family protein n=1 Tax=Candidatus Chlorohelix allophototropha TaxID=3003348 RepID=A0A8T7LWI2_9CHLR|nr:electron transfer flavoprotein subunit beta/FixA family protein [Chloroflexota bacterium]WJW65729.1 electron transfer flavoprotein subunit beta/FixA family protein [Chloroflexota bacterium L227-S17]